MLEFGLLGPLVINLDGRSVVVSAPRQRILLAVLLLRRGRVVSVDALAEVVGDGRPPSGVRGALHSGMQRLRSVLGSVGGDLIRTAAPGYLIDIDDQAIDVSRFAVLAEQGGTALAALRAYVAEQAATHDTTADRTLAIHRMLDHYLHSAFAAATTINPDRYVITPVAPQPGVVAETHASQDQALA